MSGSRGIVRPARSGSVMFAVIAVACTFAAPGAVADPQPMPDRWTQFVTDDGWVVDVNTTNEVINHIDNLAGASNSWQARVTLRSEARITGTGGQCVTIGCSGGSNKRVAVIRQ